jgi:hypothetical protein
MSVDSRQNYITEILSIVFNYLDYFSHSGIWLLETCQICKYDRLAILLDSDCARFLETSCPHRPLQ